MGIEAPYLPVMLSFCKEIFMLFPTCTAPTWREETGQGILPGTG